MGKGLRGKIYILSPAGDIRIGIVKYFYNKEKLLPAIRKLKYFVIKKVLYYKDLLVLLTLNEKFYTVIKIKKSNR